MSASNGQKVTLGLFLWIVLICGGGLYGISTLHNSPSPQPNPSASPSPSPTLSAADKKKDLLQRIYTAGLNEQFGKTRKLDAMAYIDDNDTLVLIVRKVDPDRAAESFLSARHTRRDLKKAGFKTLEVRDDIGYTRNRVRYRIE